MVVSKLVSQLVAVFSAAFNGGVGGPAPSGSGDAADSEARPQHQHQLQQYSHTGLRQPIPVYAQQPPRPGTGIFRIDVIPAAGTPFHGVLLVFIISRCLYENTRMLSVKLPIVCVHVLARCLCAAISLLL